MQVQTFCNDNTNTMIHKHFNTFYSMFYILKCIFHIFYESWPSKCVNNIGLLLKITVKAINQTNLTVEHLYNKPY